MIDSFDKQKLFDSYASALSKGWESYIKVIDLLLGLAGATALVFVASIKVGDWQTLPNREVIKYVFIFSGLSLFFGTGWRFASQHFMEYETLGSRRAAELYFSTLEIEPVTTTHHTNHAARSIYRLFFKILPIPMGVSLVAAWISIFIVFFGSSAAK